MGKFDCLEKPLRGFFWRHGRLVARHPLPFLLFPALLTAALSIGFLHKDEVTDATYLFTPSDAPSKTERQIIHQQWPVHEDNYIPGRAVTQAREVQVIAKARDDDNILLPEYKEAVVRLNMFLMNKVFVEYKGRKYYYQDLCLKWKGEGCFANEQSHLVSTVWNSGTNVTYPAFRFGTINIFLGSSLGGAELWRDEEGRDLLVSARAWLLLYQLNFHNATFNFISGLWEREVERVLLEYKDPFLTITFFHSQTLTEELKRNVEELVPKFVISFSILIFFAVSCSFTFMPGSGLGVRVDWVTSKPLLALWGVVSAGMGVGSAIGLLNFAGMPFNAIVLVMPFLAVSIGVDNMFLMVAAVRRTRRSLSVEERVGGCLADSAISITITALTDALSFGVGAITSIPAVQIFCVYTAVAIILTFLYQQSFFLALLVYQMKAEEKRRHCVTATRTYSAAEAKRLPLLTRLFALGTQPPSPLHVHAPATGPRSEASHPVLRVIPSQPPPAHQLQNTMEHGLMSDFFRDWFAPILMHPVMKVLVLIWLGIYLAFGAWGCSRLREGLKPVNLLVRDSYAIPHYDNLERFFWSYGTQVQLVFNRAPDLAQFEERDKVRTVIQAFSNTEHTLPYSASQFWLDEFERYVFEQMSFGVGALDGHDFFYSHLCHFLQMNTNNRWGEDVAFLHPQLPCNHTSNRITAFRLILGMKNFERTNSQRDTTALLRRIAARYPQYNVTTFMPLWLFTDQYALVLPNTLQNIGIALCCMLVIALLLIPQPLTALWVALTILSIDTGVVGYMTLWGVNLDAISMITIIMSIGFSVDFSAHICYGYVVSTAAEPSERVRQALGELGWPILQGALSTIFGVAVLSTVNAYMIITFFKTVFLVILLGAIHGLVFLPVLLSLFVRGPCVGGQSPADKPPPLSLPPQTASRVYALSSPAPVPAFPPGPNGQPPFLNLSQPNPALARSQQHFPTHSTLSHRPAR